MCLWRAAGFIPAGKETVASGRDKPGRSQPRVADLGAYVSECVASTDADFRDAVASCFLENVAGEPFSSDFRRYLSGEALRFYSE